MPILRLVALTVDDFTRDEPFGDLCQPAGGDLATADVLGSSLESGMADQQVDALPALAAGQGIRVLERLGDRFSLENEREALRLLRECCSRRLQAIRPTSRDVEALRDVAKESNGAATFVACVPRPLLCATVRVGEAIAWHALLEVCNSRAEGGACKRSGQTWASWVCESCESTG